MSALLFLYQDAFGRELAFLDITRATKAQRLPVVLSRKEVQRLQVEFSGRNLLLFHITYGAGLGHVSTTMVYNHVMNRPEISVRIPADVLGHAEQAEVTVSSQAVQ